MRQLRRACAIGTMMIVFGGAPAVAQTFSSGSTGADGAFAPSCSPTPCTVTVTLPASGVFNFTSVAIPSNVTVKFTRNAANTPVTILAQGDVTIPTGAVVDVSGGAGGGSATYTFLGLNGGVGGPGGFDGGQGANAVVSQTGGTGLGPGGGMGSIWGTGWGGGGGFTQAGAPGYSIPAGAIAGGPAYGSPTLLPLVGGSGGGGSSTDPGKTGGGGGGGGGALLIASSTKIVLSGSIWARGGNATGAYYGGGGSGGAVRLVATRIEGTAGVIDVTGGNGSDATNGKGSPGRIRIEAYTNVATMSFGPLSSVSVGLPSTAVLPSGPALWIASVAGVAAPPVATGSFSLPDVVLPSSTTSPVTVVVNATNIPVSPTVNVTLTVKGLIGGALASPAPVPLTGTTSASSATFSNVQIFLTEPQVISASVTYTMSATLGTGPVFVEGEVAEYVRVAATAGGRSRTTYITRSGRELTVVQ